MLLCTSFKYYKYLSVYIVSCVYFSSSSDLFYVCVSNMLTCIFNVVSTVYSICLKLPLPFDK